MSETWQRVLGTQVRNDKPNENMKGKEIKQTRVKWSNELKIPHLIQLRDNAQARQERKKTALKNINTTI